MVKRTGKLGPAVLQAALDGMEAQQLRIQGQIAEVRAMLGIRRPGRRPAAETGRSEAQPARKRRKVSVAARKKMADAQRRRWALVKKASA